MALDCILYKNMGTSKNYLFEFPMICNYWHNQDLGFSARRRRAEKPNY